VEGDGRSVPLTIEKGTLLGHADSVQWELITGHTLCVTKCHNSKELNMWSNFPFKVKKITNPILHKSSNF
jgi:hypothetical protein